MKSELLLKEFFVSVLMVTMISSCAFSLDTISAKLNEIEKNYYGYTFKGTNTSRLNRLENALYGASSSKPQKDRADKIYKDLNLGINTGAASPITQNNTPEHYQQPEDIGPKAEVGIQYPVVDKLEQKVFKKSYENEDIYIRLSRLEKHVFKKESTLSLNERVDALRDKLLGGSQLAAVDIDPSSEEIVLENGQKYIDDNQFDKQDSTYNYYSYEGSKNHIPEIQSKTDDYRANDETYSQNYDLDILEKQLFGKRYASELSSKRLARLENQLFQRTFSDDDEARIQRLLAVTTAQKTSQEYDSNKWARRLNTGIQIGSILLMVLAMIL